jgi:regulatory protein
MRIEQIEPTGGSFFLRLEDGSGFPVTEREMVSFGLFSGMELEETELAGLKAAGRAGLTLRRAADLLGRRALARRDLIRSLVDKGALPQDAEQTADRMEELGVLDDASYAAAAVRQYSARGWGEKKLRDELFRRGIDRALWEKALAQATPPEESIDLLLKKRLRSAEPDRTDYRRAADALYRRGFSWEDIEAGIRRHQENRT